MPVHAGVQPRRGVAEAFAAVLAPAAAAMAEIREQEAGFAPFGGPAQLAGGAGPGFAGQQILKGPAERIPAAKPDEVEKLVDEDAGEFGARAVEGDATLAKKGGSVDGAATVLQAPDGLDVDRTAAQLWEPGGDNKRAGAELRLGGDEDRGRQVAL